MSSGLAITIIFISFLGLAATGLPIAFALGATAMVFTLLFWGPQSLYLIATTCFSQTASEGLIAAPMFIFMANILRRSGIGDDLYKAMYIWFGPVRGGLAIGTVVICTILAALCGGSISIISMTIIALPAMLAQNYNKHMAMGSIMGGSTLGILIPPSIPMIIYSNVTGVSLGKLYMAGFLPGFLLAALFALYIVLICLFRPSLANVIPREERGSLREKIFSLKFLVLPICLITVVLVSIYSGAATPVEASGVGAAGSLICATVYRKLSLKMLREELAATFRLSAMVMWILIGAACFNQLFVKIGGEDLLLGYATHFSGSPMIIIAVMMFILFIMGLPLDEFAIIMVAAPIFVPVVVAMGFDPVWFGILFTVNMEMGMLSPPYGMPLFLMRSMAPKNITTPDIYFAVIPFMILQMICLVILVEYPQICLWLPSTMK